jgi:uncharacterized membrane protein YgdD (TMEM256/DUF423 family)
MHKAQLLWGIFFAATAVALGAFGAHALKQTVTADLLPVFETGVKYQMYHALALLLTAFLFKEIKHKNISIAGKFFIAGIFTFSFSLYLLVFLKHAALTNLFWIGVVTPIGGACFIAGWLLLFVTIWKHKL